jgi:hypothetical protein
MSNFNKICEFLGHMEKSVYGLVQTGLSCMAESLNCPKTFSENIPYRLLTKSVKHFMRFVENTSVALCKLDFIMNLFGGKLKFSDNFQLKFYIAN